MLFSTRNRSIVERTLPYIELYEKQFLNGGDTITAKHLYDLSVMVAPELESPKLRKVVDMLFRFLYYFIYIEHRTVTIPHIGKVWTVHINDKKWYIDTTVPLRKGMTERSMYRLKMPKKKKIVVSEEVYAKRQATYYAWLAEKGYKPSWMAFKMYRAYKAIDYYEKVIQEEAHGQRTVEEGHPEDAGSNERT